MGRGPDAGGSGGGASFSGVITMLDRFVLFLPAPARLLLSNAVKGWAERLEQSARKDMQPRDTEPAERSYYDVEGHQRP